MPAIKITADGYRCRFCEYTWIPRMTQPKSCPECKRRKP